MAMHKFKNYKTHSHTHTHTVGDGAVVVCMCARARASVLFYENKECAGTDDVYFIFYIYHN